MGNKKMSIFLKNTKAKHDTEKVYCVPLRRPCGVIHGGGPHEDKLSTDVTIYLSTITGRRFLDKWSSVARLHECSVDILFSALESGRPDS